MGAFEHSTAIPLITFGERKLHVADCEHVDIGALRLYFKPLDDADGFDFALLEWVSSPAGADPWGDESTACIMLHGLALFDGVRHMWWTPDNGCADGYVNYPDLIGLARAMRELAALELRFCSMSDSHDVSNPSDDELTALYERIEALEAKCALLAASLKKADTDRDAAVAIIRHADEVIGPLSRPDEVEAWERVAHPFLDRIHAS